MAKFPHYIFGIAMVCASIMMQSACANPPPHVADGYFRQAEMASRQNNMNQLMEYQQLMQGGLLAMYPEYWMLNQNLDIHQPMTIVNFVNRFPRTVMAEKLVADYAETKARNQEYDKVRQVANYIINADRSESCAIALGFNQINDRRALIEKNQVWLNTQKQPELCQQLAREMKHHTAISNQDKQLRLYRMLRVGNLAEIVALANQLGVLIDEHQLYSIASQPKDFLSTFADYSASPSNRYLYLFAIANLAKKSMNEASNQVRFDMQKYPHWFDEKTRRYVYRTLGVARMNNNNDLGFHPEALQFMQQSLGEAFNFEEAEDYAQAAIRFSSWQDVLQAIHAMSFDVQQQPIWQYWLARAYQHGNGGQQQKAKQIFAQLAKQGNYYGLLAKGQIGQAVQLMNHPSLNHQDYQRLAQDGNFQRAFTLFHLGADKSYANREWNWAVRQAKARGDDRLILAAAEQAHQLGWYDRVIFAMENRADSTKSVLAYPTPMQQSIVQYSQRFSVDPAWVYGIIRQESRFNQTAKSSAGATGLMQIMPDTAKYVAKKLGETYHATQIKTGDTNIRYGVYYISDIHQRLGRQTTLATAGYNAGPNRAKRWQPDMTALSADQYVESIPFFETREYVKAVMENATYYGLIFGYQQPIQQRMGQVQPK